jgi:hypothetical protein
MPPMVDAAVPAPFEGVSVYFHGSIDPENFSPAALVRAGTLSADEALQADIVELTPDSADYSLAWAAIVADEENVGFRPLPRIASMEMLRELALSALRAADDPEVARVAFTAFRHTDAIGHSDLTRIAAPADAWAGPDYNATLLAADIELRRSDAPNRVLTVQRSHLLEGGVFVAVWQMHELEPDTSIAAICELVEQEWDVLCREAFDLIGSLASYSERSRS